METSHSTVLPAGPTGIDDCWNRIGVQGDGSCVELEQHLHCRNCPVFAAAAAALLERTLPEDYRQQWARHYAPARQTGQADGESALVFRIGDEWLALPVSVFVEMVEMRPIHGLTRRGDEVFRGLVNVRGQLLPCVSLGNLLGVRRSRDSQRERSTRLERLLVIRGQDEGRFVFPVQEVPGIVRFSAAALQEAPATLAGVLATYTKRVLPWQDKTVGCLDAPLLLYALNGSLSRTGGNKP